MDEVESRKLLYDHQYGFRGGRSTVDALQVLLRIVDSNKLKAPNNRKFIMLITVDIKNAFNTLSWEEILNDLQSARVSPYLVEIIDNYLSDRTLKVGDSTVDLSCGVPQGSKLGPLLLILSYDSVLRTTMPDGVLLIGYADDTAIVVSARSREQLTITANIAIINLVSAIKRKGLQIAPEKTEAVILYGGHRIRDVVVEVEDVPVQSKEAIKYLGVFIDRGFQMIEQIKMPARKKLRGLL